MSKYGLVHPDDLTHDCCDIKKRLEERIEELKKLIEFYQPVKTPYCESRLEELQKILDGNEGKRD